MSRFALSLTLACSLAVAGASAAASCGNSTWEKYVRSPNASVIKPVAVIAENTTGGVSNPEGMITGDGVTEFTRSEGDAELPSIVVDFGQNVVGILSISFDGASNTTEGLPGLKLAFSETMTYLTDRSDFTRSDNAAGVCLDPRQL